MGTLLKQVENMLKETVKVSDNATLSTFLHSLQSFKDKNYPGSLQIIRIISHNSFTFGNKQV